MVLLVMLIAILASYFISDAIKRKNYEENNPLQEKALSGWIQECDAVGTTDKIKVDIPIDETDLNLIMNILRAPLKTQ